MQQYQNHSRFFNLYKGHPPPLLVHRRGGSYPDLVQGGLYEQFVDFF